MKQDTVLAVPVPYTSDITLESGIDVGQGINVGPGKFAKRINIGPWINVGHEQNVQSYVTKNPSNLKISLGHGKKSKIW